MNNICLNLNTNNAMSESRNVNAGGGKFDYLSPQTEELLLQTDQGILNVSNFDRQDGEWE